MLVPIHPGWPFSFFVLASILITILVTLCLPGTLLSLWCSTLHRATPVTDKLVIAPADGRVLSIGQPTHRSISTCPTANGGVWRFSVFDVHVNRAPVSGIVSATSYHKGAFVNASLDKAEANERQNIRMETESGQVVGRQIAGLVARRILRRPVSVTGWSLASNSASSAGSRVDIWLPLSTPVTILPGQRTVAGKP